MLAAEGVGLVLSAVCVSWLLIVQEAIRVSQVPVKSLLLAAQVVQCVHTSELSGHLMSTSFPCKWLFTATTIFCAILV